MNPNKIVMSGRLKLKWGFKLGTGIGNEIGNWGLELQLELEIGNGN